MKLTKLRDFEIEKIIFLVGTTLLFTSYLYIPEYTVYVCCI